MSQDTHALVHKLNHDLSHLILEVHRVMTDQVLGKIEEGSI